MLRAAPRPIQPINIDTAAHKDIPCLEPGMPGQEYEDEQ